MRSSILTFGFVSLEVQWISSRLRMRERCIPVHASHVKHLHANIRSAVRMERERFTLGELRGNDAVELQLATWAAINQPLIDCNTNGPCEDKPRSSQFTPQFIPEASDFDPFRLQDSMLHDSKSFLNISSSCPTTEFVPAMYHNYPRSIHAD